MEKQCTINATPLDNSGKSLFHTRMEKDTFVTTEQRATVS